MTEPIIKSLSIIAHVDHGKSTLTDAFVARAGLISDDDAGTRRWTDDRPDEQARGITIKSTGVFMDINFENKNYNLNLVDTPGHCDFQGQVVAALRITDGAIVVVDAVEGVAVQTESVLRQAMTEQIKPILLINKIDRYLFELHLTPEEAYQRLIRIIENVNSIISTYQTENSSLKLELSPELGNVFFASALHGWGFGIHNFARIYSKKGNTSEDKWMKQLWGEHFFDPETKKITSESKPGLERTFCKYILGPIFDLVNSIIDDKKEKFQKMFQTLNIKITQNDLNKTPKELYKTALKRFLPICESLLYGVAYHLPTPQEAQKYRYTTLYDGPLDDEFATAIKNCDSNGPLMLYVSKMIPMEESGRFYAFGRVFSGTVKPGQKVNIMGPNYIKGSKEDYSENKTVQRVVRMIGGKAENVDEMQSGNTVALVGIDQYLVNSGTITTDQNAYPIKTMKFSVSPVVRVSVSCKNQSELPKLVEGLKKLAKSDTNVLCYTTEEGEHIVAGVGELHVEICLEDLRKFTKSELVVGEPIVPLRETILSKSSITCMSKSPNRHNRLYVQAEPLDPELVTDMTNGIIKSKDDVNTRSKILISKYGWDSTDSKKIWSIGPEGNDETNMLVDTTKGVQYLNEIKDHLNSAFHNACRNGVLCGEPVSGIRFNLADVVLHPDAIHRGGGQLIPTAKNVYYACQLASQPAILEPIYQVEISTPQQYVGQVYSCLNYRRGRVTSEEKNPNSPIYIIKGFLPVMESFGFDAYIREQCSGQASPQLVFDHWEIMEGDPLDPKSKVGQIVRATRKRKGMSEDIPSLDKFHDKL
jgi:elongation factor 2